MIPVEMTLRCVSRRRIFNFNNVGSVNCLMNNRERARRALAVTVFVILVLTATLGQSLFKTRARTQQRSCANTNLIGTPETRIPRDSFARRYNELPISSSTHQQGVKRNIGAFFDKLRAGA